MAPFLPARRTAENPFAGSATGYNSLGMRENKMGKLFNGVMRVVSTLLGVLMIAMGGIWVLQGLNVAFLDSFMAGDPQWAVYGAILAVLGVGQVVWSNTRRR